MGRDVPSWLAWHFHVAAAGGRRWWDGGGWLCLARCLQKTARTRHTMPPAGGSAWLDAYRRQMPTEDSTHQAYHAAGGGKQRAPRVRPRSGCLRLERAWRMASRGSGGTKVLGKSKVPGESNEKSNRGSHEGPDRCEASPPKHECAHLSARSETPFCVTAVCVCGHTGTWSCAHREHARRRCARPGW